MATKTELYVDYLKREGYVPDVLETGDIRFKVQGETLVLTPAEEDPGYFKLTYYHMWDPKSTNDSWEAINAVNARVKVVKVCVAGDVIFLTTESILNNISDFEALFPRFVSLIGAGIQVLRESLNESKTQS